MKQLWGSLILLGSLLASERPVAAARAAPGRGSGGGKLSLVAYSTPQEAYEALIPAFQKTAAGKGVSSQQSYGASGEQSRAVEARPAGRRRRRSRSSPTCTRLVDAGARRRRLEPERVQGHRHRLGRRPRRPQGQPEEHQELGRPDQARRRGHHAEPVHLGRRALERHGRLRRAAQAGQVAEAGRTTT